MIQKLFIAFLEKENIIPTKLKDNLLSFEYKHMNFLFEYLPEDDTNFFRIMLPNIDIYANERNQILNKLNREFKLGKLIEVRNNIWITAESFVYSTLEIDKLFSRLINLLMSMIREYRQEIDNERS